VVEAPAGAGAEETEANMPASTTISSKRKNRSNAPKAERKGARRTKADTILNLLKRPKGASVADLQKATGWQSHSVRAALTGLRKKGHAVDRTKDDAGITRYRIAGER
jgi:hypothetical protein